MLAVFIKSTIIFIVILVIMRIMGKRQLGEMQPFELVITLIIAEVACIPMNDPFIPLYHGIVPIITLATLHIALSFIARKSSKARSFISGHSIIVIDKDGIVYENLKKMNINVNDLIESIRSGGYVDINEIEYAIFETNGKLCVVEKFSDPTKYKPPLLPLPLFIDGAWDKKSLLISGISEDEVMTIIKKKGYKNKDILYIDIRQDGLMYINPKKDKYFTQNVKLKGGKDW